MPPGNNATEERGNLFKPAPGNLQEELVEVLARGEGPVRIERIVSRGHASPPDFWYDQDTVEWVALLSGSAVLRIEGEEDPVRMNPGDFVRIPAHCRHRVEETSGSGDTVWLAVHWAEERGERAISPPER